ncbi:MAG: 6-phosphogluconolactonase [Deltaproteobacteria bacterium]|nr:6-phosphogluconolactonase [Deltaproteobacteria bacterium]
MIIKPEIIVSDDAAQAAHKGAALLAGSVKQSLIERNLFALALSGAATPRSMHRTFAREPYRSHVPWHRVHVFWVDDRCVCPGDPASNYGAARADLLDRVPIPARHVHPMPFAMEPGEGALSYEQEMRAVLESEKGEGLFLDMMFLGLGLDGHVASLFPGDKSLEERDRLVIAVRGGDPDLPRLTMTLPLINRTRQIVFLVTGKDKAPVVRSVLEGEGEDLPARRVQPLEGTLTWLLDREAASMIHLRG